MISQVAKKRFILIALILVFATPQSYGAGETIESPTKNKASDRKEVNNSPTGAILGGTVAGVAAHKLGGNIEVTLLSTVIGALIGDSLQDDYNSRVRVENLKANEAEATKIALGSSFNTTSVYDWSVLRPGVQMPRSEQDILVRGYYSFVRHGFYDEMYCREFFGVAYDRVIKVAKEISGYYCLTDQDNQYKYYPPGSMDGKKYEKFDAFVSRLSKEKRQLRREIREEKARQNSRPPIIQGWGCWGYSCRTF